MPHSVRRRIAKTYQQFSRAEAESQWAAWWSLFILAAFVGSVVFAGGRMYVPNLFWGYALSVVLGVGMRVTRQNFIFGAFTFVVIVVAGVLIGAAGVG